MGAEPGSDHPEWGQAGEVGIILKDPKLPDDPAKIHN